MPSSLKNLHETNRRMSFWLDRVVPPHTATPELMAGLLSELLRVGTWLRIEPLPTSCTDTDLNLELDRYRGNVERLRDLLPSMHSELLAERARLESQRVRVQSAAEWARASRQAL